MSSELLTASAVMRMPCIKGWPPEPVAPRLSAPVLAGVAAAAKAELPAEAVRAPREPDDPRPPAGDEPDDPRPPPDGDADAVLVLLKESRSLAEPYMPDPGAIWFSGLSRRLPDDDDPPPNISVSTRAIWRASPCLTRYT